MKLPNPKPDHNWFVLKNIILPTIPIAVIAQFLSQFFKIEIISDIGMGLIMIVGLFYLIYGLLWEFKKVKGGLFLLKK